ncbi:hypothetical protein F5146DRAFT_1222412 [Armillaria mellea]|nr:hypothetical protein F5146DRAFT_1222412 [Armillaria mellea]
MSCLTCTNCGFINLLPTDPQVHTRQTIQGSDGFVSQLLHGSRPLLDADHALLDAEITKLKRLKSWYDAQLPEISLARATVLKELKNRESIHAPIRRLSRDILIEIFHSLCDYWRRDVQLQFEDGNVLRFIEPDSLDMAGPLWVLGRVCGLWRDTLHASPASWARHVSVRSPLVKYAPAILQTYLKCTCEHPLSLVVIFNGVDITREGEIMTLLIQSCHRWKNVRIHTTTDHIHRLESISYLPILQTIDINISDDDDSNYSSNIFLNAPQLWQATLWSQGIYQISLPPTITHFSGHITSAKDFQSFSQLPKLRTCRLTSLIATASIKALLVVAELRQLLVQDLDVLNLLTAPMLQSLTIAGGPWELLSCVPAFFRRSGCHLESFGVGMTMMESESSASIRDFFSSEACSTISYLKLELGSVWHIVSNAIASSSVLPNLQHLVLCFYLKNQYFRHKDYKTERHALLDMIRSRCKTGLLNTIELQLYGDDEEIAGDIRALIGDKLEVRVEEWSPLAFECQSAFWDPQPHM